MKITRQRNRISQPRFYLKDPESSDETSIFMIYNYRKGSENRLKYYTSYKIKPSDWDQKKERPKAKVSNPEHLVLKTKLDRIQACAERVNSEKKLTKAEFKIELDRALGYLPNDLHRSTFLSFFEYFEKYISDLKNAPNPTSTWKKYQTILNQLKTFCIDNDLISLDYGDINLDFKSKFASWLYSPPRNHSVNSANKSFEVIKKIMRETSKQKHLNSEGISQPYHSNLDIFENAFEQKRIKTSRHPLTKEELVLLHSFDLSDKPKYQRIKDLFLIACYTGLRFSDLIKLKKENIYEEKGFRFIKLFTQKANRQKKDNEVVIPIIPQLLEIIEKYNYKLPTDISNQKVNIYLKEMGEITGLHRLVQIKKSVAGSVIEEFVPLHKTLKMHTARYTFITLCLNDYDISPVELSKVTGQSIKVLLEYERADKIENASHVLLKMLSK